MQQQQQQQQQQPPDRVKLPGIADRPSDITGSSSSTIWMLGELLAQRGQQAEAAWAMC
jgi:hypothetical protein